MQMKFPLILKKTGLFFFTFPKKQLDSELNIKLNGKKLYENDSFKYLGTPIDNNWTWKQQINHVTIKLS